MTKVYCKNCKWFDSRFIRSCSKITRDEKVYNQALGKSIREIEHVGMWWFKLNKDNNCSHYRRKRWKFWVK